MPIFRVDDTILIHLEFLVFENTWKYLNEYWLKNSTSAQKQQQQQKRKTKKTKKNKKHKKLCTCFRMVTIILEDDKWDQFIVIY